MARRFNTHILINSLDNPKRILFFRLDEFLILAVGFFLSIAFGNALFLVGGAVLRFFYKKFVVKMARGALQSRIYWHLPYAMLAKQKKFRTLPPSHIRRYFL
jgi:type IV conjugative transfer system protein TraL